MAAPLPSNDILGVFKALKDDITSNILSPRGLSIKSSGTKVLALPQHATISTTTGFWDNPQAVSTKPPRWIIQVKVQSNGSVSANFAVDGTGQPIPMGRTVGYINNRDGSCAVTAFRILPAIKTPNSSAPWQFPQGWEFLLVLGFAQPLPAGTSGDPLTNFDPGNRTILFGGGTSKRKYHIDFCALVKAPVVTPSAAGTTYNDVANAISSLIGAQVYDGSVNADRDRLITDLEQIFTTSNLSIGPFSLAEDTSLVGVDRSVYQQIEAAINSGKRHIILYGPPGTGKTTLAEYLARELAEQDDGDGSYIMLTASSAWSVQDLVGGYQPLGNGAIGFIPGALLRNFDKPTIIDELNRCPIDKVLGPLFSILSGQSSVLPCRVDAADPGSSFHVVLPEQRQGMKEYEHAPGPNWRLICTLNTYDKTQLGQISYALSRRFAWIKIGVPSDPDSFVMEISSRLGVSVPNPVQKNPIGAMWKYVNSVREIGGAPIVDFIKTLLAIDENINLFSTPSDQVAEHFLGAFRMCVLPLMDGISPRDADNLADNISSAWELDENTKLKIKSDCREFSA